MRVRKVRCAECGAPKVTPSKSAYVYCDFCGRFMDWDGEIAKQSGGVATGPHYRELTEALAPRLAAARAAKDKTALAACHRQLFDQFMTDCATTYSPRMGDPAYREAMLVRSVHAQVARELDPGCIAADAAVAEAAAKLAWGDSNGPRVRPDTFWRMYDAIVEADVTVKAYVLSLPEAAADPDDTPASLSGIMRDSMVVQAWLAYLDAKTAEQLLDRTRMRKEYETIPDPVLLDTTCAGCGTPSKSPAGARRAVCESCGRTRDLGTVATCSHCGAAIRFPIGTSTTSCSYCKTEARLIAGAS